MNALSFNVAIFTEEHFSILCAGQFNQLQRLSLDGNVSIDGAESLLITASNALLLQQASFKDTLKEFHATRGRIDASVITVLLNHFPKLKALSLPKKGHSQNFMDDVTNTFDNGLSKRVFWH